MSEETKEASQVTTEDAFYPTETKVNLSMRQ